MMAHQQRGVQDRSTHDDVTQLAMIVENRHAGSPGSLSFACRVAQGYKAPECARKFGEPATVIRNKQFKGPVR